MSVSTNYDQKTCEQCKRWCNSGHLIVIPDRATPIRTFQIGLCTGIASDHFGHLVIDQHPVCEQKALKG